MELILVQLSIKYSGLIDTIEFRTATAVVIEGGEGGIRRFPPMPLGIRLPMVLFPVDMPLRGMEDLAL
jgi:hypothetical protein